MTTKRQDSGGSGDVNPPEIEMGLRDWFAGQALTALVLSPKADQAAELAAYAETAYAQADAMLAERSRRESDGPDSRTRQEPGA